MKRKPIKAAPRSVSLPVPKPLGYFEVSRHLDRIETARIHLVGALAIATALIDEDREYDDGIVVTLERLIKADLAALDAGLQRVAPGDPVGSIRRRLSRGPADGHRPVAGVAGEGQ